MVKKEDLQPSWSDIVDALDYLEEEELPQKLRDKYCWLSLIFHKIHGVLIIIWHYYDVSVLICTSGIC